MLGLDMSGWRPGDGRSVGRRWGPPLPLYSDYGPGRDRVRGGVRGGEPPLTLPFWSFSLSFWSQLDDDDDKKQ